MMEAVAPPSTTCVFPVHPTSDTEKRSVERGSVVFVVATTDA